MDIESLATEVWTTIGGRSRSGDVRFVLDIAPEASPLDVDADALRQIFTNLLDNSLRYTPAGGRIQLRAQVEEEAILVEVHDSGSGIPREHLARVFERFYRIDASRSREEGGTGLGLAIVKHLVEAHGGRVVADSDLGQGTAIRIWFPKAPQTT